jgi:hypothetical protein
MENRLTLLPKRETDFVPKRQFPRGKKACSEARVELGWVGGRFLPGQISKNWLAFYPKMDQGFSYGRGWERCGAVGQQSVKNRATRRIFLSVA